MPAITTIVTVTLALMGPPAERLPGAADGVITVPQCLMTLIEEAQVPSKEAGVITQIPVREGMEVKAGDVLALIDDKPAAIKQRAAEFEFDVAREQATNDVRVRAAKAAADVAKWEHESALTANRTTPGAFSQSEIRRRELQSTNSKLQIELADMEYRVEGLTAKVKGAAVEAAEEDVARRRIIAPFDGVVVQVYKHPGEWVSPGDQVLRLVRMDRLRVEGFLSAQDYTPQQVRERDVSVVVQLTRDRTATLTGKIDFASPIVEASGEYRIWAEVENTKVDGSWLVRPGLRGNMTIQTGGALTPRAATLPVPR